MWLRSLVASAVLLVACEAAPNRGAVCAATRDCHAGLVCRFGLCRDECAENRDCPSGSSCLVGSDGAGACSLDVDLGCETGTGRECATGLTCLGDRCVQTCDGPADCPADGECRPVPGSMVSFCFDPRLPQLDAGPIEDSGIDAATVDGGTDAQQPEDAGADAQDTGPIATPAGPRDLCIGGGFICAIVDTEVHCWGDAKYGALGPGPGVACDGLTLASDYVITPGVVQTATGPLDGVDGLACGAEFACAHLASGEVWCWGRNQIGQLARPAGAPACSASAVQVTFASPPATESQVFASSLEACVFDTTTGGLQCWGRDTGILQSTASTVVTPTLALAPFDAAVPRLAAIAPGPDFACGLTSRGELFCWGDGFLGQTGATDRASNPTGLRGVRAGTEHVVGLAAPEVYTWGSDRWHEQEVADHAALPDCDAGVPCQRVPTLSSHLDLARVESTAGARFSCAIRSDSTVDCWGRNGAAQSGAPVDDAGVNDLGDPVETSTGVLMGASSIYVGFENACARVGTDLYCWGANDRGQLQSDPPDGGAAESARAVVMTP